MRAGPGGREPPRVSPAVLQPAGCARPMRVLHFISSGRTFQPFFSGLGHSLDPTAVEMSVCTMEPKWEFHRELAGLGIRAHGLGLGCVMDKAEAD